MGRSRQKCPRGTLPFRRFASDILVVTGLGPVASPCITFRFCPSQLPQCRDSAGTNEMAGIAGSGDAGPENCKNVSQALPVCTVRFGMRSIHEGRPSRNTGGPANALGSLQISPMAILSRTFSPAGRARTCCRPRAISSALHRQWRSPMLWGRSVQASGLS